MSEMVLRVTAKYLFAFDLKKGEKRNNAEMISPIGVQIGNDVVFIKDEFTLF